MAGYSATITGYVLYPRKNQRAQRWRMCTLDVARLCGPSLSWIHPARLWRRMWITFQRPSSSELSVWARPAPVPQSNLHRHNNEPVPHGSRLVRLSNLHHGQDESWTRRLEEGHLGVKHFSATAYMLSTLYAIARPSVHLSVCPSHRWISQKRLS